MVTPQAAVFSALAEPTRLGIVEILMKYGELPVSDISSKFSSSASAISQHLKVLREARLVIVKKRAQQRLYQINIRTLSEIEEWVHIRTHAWNSRLTAMEQYLQENK